MAVGSGAGHAAPTTPLALVNVIVETVAGPATAAVPLQTVPFAAVPENVNCPLNVDPLTAPLMSPAHETVVDCHVPLTSAPDCVSTMFTSTVSLLDDAIVPFQVPAMLVVVPLESGLGAAVLPPHAAVPAIRQTMSATRMAPLSNTERTRCKSSPAWPRRECSRTRVQDSSRSGGGPLTDLTRRQSRNRCAAPAIIASVSTAIAHSPATPTTSGRHPWRAIARRFVRSPIPANVRRNAQRERFAMSAVCADVKAPSVASRDTARKPTTNF